MHNYLLYFMGALEIHGIVVAFELIEKIAENVDAHSFFLAVEGEVEGDQLKVVLVEREEVIVGRD